ncbi:hypothetical protein MAPG_05032 [Magnaporthiopsis poae ATCC 64411]|uniref:Peptidase A1 domain-containing protein n=1 Tax=Magnaporthiopsis poae (strain ATCC 64411 / 73-15) TaxID=644358 RepID=A0A0C4DYB5_MAGP6|nr:hypothetical protein MAPG_05032 [Magnaporthiopsis poae ATCC 64411]
MPCFAHILVVATTLSAAAVANPVVKGQPDAGGFTLQAENVRRQVQSGPMSVYMTHLRYDADVPPALAAAVKGGGSKLGRRQGKQQGTAPSADSRHDTEWLTPIQIGTPPQTVRVQLDTGSSDLWAFSTGLEAGGHAIYDPSKSSTATKLPDITWAQRYVGGDWGSGDTAYRDVVKVADGVVVKNQAVLPATNASDGFLDSPYDGIMGLSLLDFGSTSPLDAPRPKNFFQTVLLSLREPFFAADLKAGKSGFYDFGVVPPNRHKGKVVYVPVNPYPIRNGAFSDWNITLAGYAIGKSASFTKRRFDTLVDTGTSLMYVDKKLVEDYYAQVKGSHYDAPAGGYVFPCDAALPDLSLGVNGAGLFGGINKILTVPGSYINFAPRDETKKECFGAVQKSLEFAGEPMSILGAAAIKAAYVIFEDARPAQDTPRIGFAVKDL